MRVIIIFITFFSFSSFACIPCAKNSAVIVTKQALPVFPSSYKTEISAGHVTFSLDVYPLRKVENIKIIERYPNDLPREVLIKMINNSQFKLTAPKTDALMLPCSIKGNEYTFELDSLPQKIKIEISEISL